ncbi:MAG: peptide transporter, partial [Methanobacterium sp.]
LTLDNYTKNTTKTVKILNNILGLNREEALTLLTNNYSLSLQEAQNDLNYTHPNKSRPFILVTTNNMIKKGYWTFYFGSWDFNKLQGADLTYTFGNISINSNILNSTNGILMNLNNNNITWNKESPYSVIISNNSKIEKHYIDKNSDFSVILNINSNKSVVITKGFENSLFTKLVIEKSNSTNFKPIYTNNNVIVWKST